MKTASASNPRRRGITITYVQPSRRCGRMVAMKRSHVHDTDVGNMAPPPPLPEPNPYIYVRGVGKMHVDDFDKSLGLWWRLKNNMSKKVPPPPVIDTDRINRVTGEMTTQQPIVNEPIDPVGEYNNGLVAGVIIGVLVYVAFELLIAYLGYEYVVR